MKKYLQPGHSIYRPLALISFIVVTVLLTIPGDAFPKEKMFARIFLDKIIHVLIFGGMLFCFFMWLNDVQQFKKILIAGIVYGIVMEFVQEYLCYHRSLQLTDMIADALGCILGWLVANSLIRNQKK